MSAAPEAPTLNYTTPFTKIQRIHSESSFSEPLNFSPALRSPSSPFPHPHDFTSSITASPQSSWLPQPVPQAYRQAPPPNTTNKTTKPQPDFVLFDQPVRASTALRPQLVQSGSLLGPPPSIYRHSSSTPFSPSLTDNRLETSQPQTHSRQRPPVPLFSSISNTTSDRLQHSAKMADLNSNNAFDSGASLRPGFQDGFIDSPQNYHVYTFSSANATPPTTVSPRDIFTDASLPPSTTFTNMTTPDMESYHNTPSMFNSFFDSPLLQGSGMDPDGEYAYPLFTEQEPFSESAAPTWNTINNRGTLSNQISQANHQPVNYHSSLPQGSPPVPAPMERNQSNESNQPMSRSGSSNNGSPLTMGHKMHRKSSSTSNAAVNGISKQRRPRMEKLPEIRVDPNDKTAVKRMRNTLAARESRERKFHHVQTLEMRIAEMEAERERLAAEKEKLAARNSELEAQSTKTEFKNYELKMRIAELEARHFS